MRYKQPKHGTRYEYTKHHCRCDPCIAANRLYIREQKKRLKPGTRYAQRIFEILSNSPCCQCGESDPIVLDFDHIDPMTKTDTISNLVHRDASWLRIETELKKCQVLCANCHRRKTAGEQNWQRRSPL